jgi:WD40 repeat protein
MQDNQSKAQLEILAAHADNIKQVMWLGEQLVVSGSADRTVKLWDLRQTASAISTLKVE